MTFVKLKDAKTEAERQAAITAALEATGGDKTAAAALLGIARQTLHRQLGTLGAGKGEELLVNLSVAVPLRCMEWLEVEALRRKHADGASHAAKGPIVAELIRKAMDAPR